MAELLRNQRSDMLGVGLSLLDDLYLIVSVRELFWNFDLILYSSLAQFTKVGLVNMHDLVLGS